MTSATNFAAAFLAAYDQARGRLSDAEWQSQWSNTYDWSKFMIYGRDPKAVVRTIADSFNESLQCWEDRPYEPLHLDAVFHAKNCRSWFPIHVAIEHENFPRTFVQEIKKLLSIRCPLKVGITYVLKSDGSQPDLQSGIENDIRREFAAANCLIQENGSTEYLFLLGYEINRRELQWRKLTFSATNGAGRSRVSASKRVVCIFVARIER